MATKYIIGIDAGTTNVKSVLFDLEGNEVFVESIVNNPYYLPNNEIEQDMDVVWQNVLNSITLLMRRNKINKDDVLGIGVTGQGEGIWLIDEYGRPVQNSLLWSDGRAYKEVEYLTTENKELGDRATEVTGMTPFPGAQLVLLMWMAKNRPEVLDKAENMFFCKDWIRFKLTGEVYTDITDAGTSLLDLRTNKPAEEIFTKLGLEEYLRLIPEIKDPHELGGHLTEKMAENIGLNAGIPIVMGGIDLVCSMVGMGAVARKDVGIVLGTTTGTQVVLNQDECNFGDSRYENHATEGLYISMNPTMNGMPNIDWVVREIALSPDFDMIDNMIKDVESGSGGVIYHPYIGAAGERSPFTNTNAKASFFGVNAETTRASLVKSVYEGMIFSIKDCLLKAFDDSEIYISGGGAKSTIIPQLIADATGMTVNISNGKELGAKGAAIMLGVNQGYYEDYEDARDKTCKVERSLVADPDKKFVYDEYFKLFKELRLSYDKLWNMRRSTMDTIAEHYKK